VGVVVPFVDRWFFAVVIDTVERALRLAGYDLLLYNLGDEQGRTTFFESMPMRKRVDALIVVSLVLSEQEFEALASMDIPVALLGLARDGTISIRIDDAGGARLAVDHLLSLGHRRIGLVGGDTEDPMRFTPPLHRRTGYRTALRDAGVDLDPALEVLGYFTADGGTEATDRLLLASQRPTAIFAESDEMAFGALRAIRRSGLRVPEDVALIGFDDHQMAELMDLSTVRQRPAEQARAVTEGLLAVLADPTATPRDLVVDTELVVRGSTDPMSSLGGRALP
jgi:LacI family repressor for deo operon, udp, cdd, tsx, nupC, and nupG